MNTKLRKKAKNNFDKDFFKLTNHTDFGKTMENVSNHRNIKFLTTERRGNYLVSEPNYDTKEIFTEYLLPIELRKTQILMNETVYLGFSILDLSKTVIYEFQYYYVKLKYRENAKLCHMDKGSFIVHVKAEDIYKYIAEDVETRFDISNLELDRPFSEGKNKNVI